MSNKLLASLVAALSLGAFADPYVLYVSPSGNDAAAGDSMERPLKTINRAISEMQRHSDLDELGGTIYLGNGTYSEEAPTFTTVVAISNTAVVVTNSISIEGLSGDPKLVTVKRNADYGKFRLFYLNNEKAALRNLTISDGELGADWLYGGGVSIDSLGGTVANCIVENCKNGGNGQFGGAGIYMKKGRVTHTTVRNCRGKNGRNYGVGIYAESGLIDNCLVTGCVNAHHHSSNGNGAVCLMGDAKMVNSTVAKNTSCFVSGLIVGSPNAQAVNCAVYGNTLCTQPHNGEWTTSYTGCRATSDVGKTGLAPRDDPALDSAFVNCASENFPEGAAGCVGLTESPFVDFDDSDFAILNHMSPLANTGNSERAAEICDSLLDLAGRNRYSGLHVDIGAYELQEGFSVRGWSDTTYTLLVKGGQVTFSAETSGSSGTVTYTWDFGDGSELVSTTEASVTHAYTVAGKYSPTVKATDGSSTLLYPLLEPIDVVDLNFVAVPDSYAIPTGANAVFSIIGVTVEDVVTYVWDFGDGATLTTTERSAVHQYALPGKYSVSVVGTTEESGSYRCDLEEPMRVVPHDLYVKPVNMGAGEPYDSWEKAGTKLAEVLAYAVDGCVIHLAPGSYDNDKSSNVMVDKAVTVVGEGASPSDVVIPGHATNTGKRNMCVMDSGALVCNLTLYGGFTSQSDDPNLNAGGGNLYLVSGTVSNCVLSSGRTRSSGPDGGAARVTGGLLTHCIITNSFSANRGNGFILTQSGGRVSNCLITSNKREWETSRNPISLVYVSGGVIDNCTISKCWIFYNTKEGKYQTTDKAVQVTGTGKAYNLAIADISYVGYSAATDSVVDYPSATPQRWAGTAANFVKCVTDDAAPINETCSVGTTETMFRDYANGDLTPGPALKNKGGAVEGYAFPSVDLAGLPRLNRAIDVGCYEKQPVAGMKIRVR